MSSSDAVRAKIAELTGPGYASVGAADMFKPLLKLCDAVDEAEKRISRIETLVLDQVKVSKEKGLEA